MIVTWNGVYHPIGQINIGTNSFEIFSNHVEKCSIIFSKMEGIVFAADWDDDRWKTLLNNRRKKDLLRIVKDYAKNR